MTHPCPIEHILSPNEIDWNLPLNEPVNRDQYFVYWDPHQINKFQHLDLLSLSKKTDLIEVRTGAALVNKFHSNKKLHKRIRELGYEPSKFKLHYLIYEWYGKMFKLNSKLKTEYEAYLREIKDKKLICAQIRVGGQNDDQFTRRTDVKKYWDLIRDKFITKIKNESYMIYVTSDMQDVKQEAKKEFGLSRVLTNEKSSGHLDKSFQDSATNCENESIENIIMDFHLLQNCDMAVVSQSGFGLLGLWNRKEPSKDLYVHTNQNLTNDYWNRDNLRFLKVTDLDNLYFE